jgi:hypothetical protein
MVCGGERSIDMAATQSESVVLDCRQAAFLLGPVSMNVASRDAALTPSVGRAFGCRIAADGRELTVFLSTSHAAAVLRDLRAGAPFAAVFSRPQTHESRQIKARGVRIEALTPGDIELIRAYGDAFVAECVPLGYAERFMRGFFIDVEDDAVAVTFTPAAMFEQTPGPDAGKRMVTKP